VLWLIMPKQKLQLNEPQSYERPVRTIYEEKTH